MRKFFRDTSGAAFTEFAFAAPILILLAIGVADFGVLMSDSTALEAAVRSGAEMARSNTSVTTAQMTSLFPTNATINTRAMTCSCIDGTTVTPCPPTQGTTPCVNAVNTYVTPNFTDTRVLERISVSASETPSSMIPWWGLAFPASLNPTADARIQ